MEEWFVKGGNNWLELAMWVDMDDRDNNYKEVTFKMPLIKVVDVAVTHGMMADDSNYQKLSVSKVLDNNFMFGLEVLDGARDGEFMDSAAIFMGYRF